MLTEEVLPLGSVVDLKKELFSFIKDVDRIRIVITYRFLAKEESKGYFPYAGVVYPTGMLGRKEVIYFTPALIEQVVHRGFEDIQEHQYIYLMKREFIIEKGMKSFGFGTREEIENFMKEKE